jgi:hypothetical protein
MDLSSLDYMNEPALLHCMRMRFCGGDLTSLEQVGRGAPPSPAI